MAERLFGRHVGDRADYQAGGRHLRLSHEVVAAHAIAELREAEITIQHYQIGERLGAGGTGEVYLAEDVRFGRPACPSQSFIIPHGERRP
jgi:serine/threonine protein kinase